jgi:putative membrane protein
MTAGETQTELPYNLNTELAKERTHAAYDRTLMAWIRTALTLIGFGIGIFEFAQKTGGATIFKSSKLIGLLFVLLGIISVLLAIRENKLDHYKLLNPHLKYDRKSSLGISIGYALLLIGLFAIIHIIYKISQQWI